MDKETAYTIFTECEYATEPIDNVIPTLYHIIDTYNFADQELDSDGELNLLTGRKTICSLLLLSIDALKKARADFYKVHDMIKESSDPETTNESAN